MEEGFHDPGIRRHRSWLVIASLLGCSICGPGSFAADRRIPRVPSGCWSRLRRAAGSDALARIITPKLADALGQTWVVDNRGGAGGNLAAETVPRRHRTGTRCSWVLHVLTVNPALYKLSFSMEARTSRPDTARHRAIHMVINAKCGEHVKDFIALARQSPVRSTSLQAARETPLHLAAAPSAGAPESGWFHVPYKGGGPRQRRCWRGRCRSCRQHRRFGSAR